MTFSSNEPILNKGTRWLWTMMMKYEEKKKTDTAYPNLPLNIIKYEIKVDQLILNENKTQNHILNNKSTEKNYAIMKKKFQYSFLIFIKKKTKLLMTCERQT